MHVVIVGFNLPGRTFCRPDGSVMSQVHVGVQVRRDPADLVPGDATEARWDLDVDVVPKDGQLDFRGPAVQGSRGDRFMYLTWGNVRPEGHFEMFRRAKLMLNRVDRSVMDAAVGAGGIQATVDLSGSDGTPRCARVDPPAIQWSSAEV